MSCDASTSRRGRDRCVKSRPMSREVLVMQSSVLLRKTAAIDKRQQARLRTSYGQDCQRPPVLTLRASRLI